MINSLNLSPEPVFCQAIEIVDGLRIGCSHKGQRDGQGDLLPMRRAGPRAPYMILCKLHFAQMAKHMCCPACGLFCTQVKRKNFYIEYSIFIVNHLLQYRLCS